MTNEELRAQLDAAKEFKAARIAEAQSEVEQARLRLEEASCRLSEWSAMIPYDVIRFMADDSQRKAVDEKEAERRARLETMRAAALQEAYELNKGMLPPHAASKSTAFGLFGGGIGGLLAPWAVSSFLGVHSQLALGFAGLVGFVIGLFAGFEIFGRNFVVDESLEEPPLFLFSAHEPVRRKYYQNLS